MRFLVIIHEENTPLQNTLDWLKEGRHTHAFCHLHKGEMLPAQDTFDAVIVNGGHMDVDQEDEYPWLKSEKDFILRTMKAKKKMLGICLGAQLISHVLGARVSKHPHWEVGWLPVDTILTDKPLQVFTTHGYSFDVPPGGKLIATGTHWKNQGFAIGSHVAAFQFHPEVTGAWAEKVAAAKKPEGSFPLVQNEKEILQQMGNLPTLTSWYFRFLDYFFLEKN